MSTNRIFKAPWGRALKLISCAVVLICISLAVAADGGLAEILPYLLFTAVPFMVRGYAVEEGVLKIRRPGWQTRIPLAGLQSVEVVPNALRGALRLFGNGGLFSITGLYRTRQLGNFRAFVNDLNRTVVLRFPGRTVVVSPDDPEGFVDCMKPDA